MLMLEVDREPFFQGIGPLIIPKEKVVTVRPDWTLERALVVLTRHGVSSVPVISKDERVEGLISKTNILDFLLTANNERIHFENISKRYVAEAMNQNHGGIMANSMFSFAFEVLIDRPYIPIIDVKNRFLGILTRKVVMEKVTEYFQKEFMERVMIERKQHSHG